LKEKFSNNWTSVKKAFLDLDADYDGFIAAEDIIRYFGGNENSELSYQDLKALMQEKDTKNQQGLLSY